MDIPVGPDFNRALSFLRNASTDNERLAALLLVTKTVNANVLSQEERQQLLNAISSKFLTRLLKTVKTPADCSPSAFRAVAIAILSCFSTDDELVVHPVMISSLEAVNEIITSASGCTDDDEELKMTKDCYDILACMAGHPLGRIAMCEHGSLAALCHAFNAENRYSQSALHVIQLIVRSESECAWKTSAKGLTLLLEKLSRILKEEKDEITFVSCHAILDILSSRSFNDLNLQPVFWRNVCHGLFDLLRSRIGEVNRDLALQLASQVVRIYGMEAMRNIGESSEQLLPLLVHLSSIEVRMILEDPNVEQLASDKSHLLASCFSILESAIVFLYADLASEADEKLVVKFYSAVNDAFLSVVSYTATFLLPEKQPQILSSNCFACLRLIGAYVGEDEYVQREEFASVLPLILNICIFSFMARRLCCKTCQSKIARVAFSTVESRNGSCRADGAVVEPDNSTVVEPENNANGANNGSTSRLQLKFISNLVQLNEFVASVLLEEEAAMSRREDLSDQQDILESLSLKCEELGDSVHSGKNAADAITGNSTNTAETYFKIEGSSVAADSGRASEVLCERNLDQNSNWYKKLFGSSKISNCICGKVLSPITNKSLLGRTSEDEKTDVHATLPDVVRFLLPGLPLMCDFDQTRTILYESKFPFLLVRYFCDAWSCLVGEECDAEVTLVITYLSEALLNLLAHPDLPTSDPALINLFEFLIKHMNQFVSLVTNLDASNSRWTVFGHLIALGLKLSTSIGWNSCSLASEVKGHLKEFVEYATVFMSSIFEVESVGDVRHLRVTESFEESQDLTLVLVLTSLEGLGELVKRHRFLAAVILDTEWIRQIVQQLNDVRGNGLEERKMLLIEMENLLCTLAASDHDMRTKAIGLGCLSLASLYKMEVLEAVLKPGKCLK